MTQYYKPMLAGKLKDIAVLRERYPLLASPKFDGVRATVQNGQVMSRKLKLIPNPFVQKLFGRKEFEGFDGELIVGDPTASDVFRHTSSAVMRHTGEPPVTFWVFDCAIFPDIGFERRFSYVPKIVTKIRKKLPNWQTPNNVKVVQSCVQLVPQTRVEDEDALEKFENYCVGLGFEGICLRCPFGRYKHGRSTIREGWLMKLKRFLDGEATVIGVEELLHNDNVVTINELGHKQRSNHKAGKRQAGMMGALIVRDRKTKVVFNIGTGFSLEERHYMWDYRVELVDKRTVVRYKYFPTVKDKPRIPVFDGIRDKRDL